MIPGELIDLIAAAVFICLELLFSGTLPRYVSRSSDVFQDLLWYASNQAIERVLSICYWLIVLPVWTPIFTWTGEGAAPSPWLQFAIAFFLVDLCAWCIHFLFHRFPSLWKFHKLHHSSQRIDWLAGFRTYWLDGLAQDFFASLPLLLIPFDPAVTAAMGLVMTMSTFVVHADIKQEPRWISRWLILWNFHRVHHLAASRFSYGQNFGVLTTTWDRLMGTYVSNLDVGPDERVYGLPANDDYPSGYFARLTYPFR